MSGITIDRNTIEQAEFYLTAFGVSGLSKVKIAGEGRIATNYIAYSSDGGSYILRIYNLEQGRELGYGRERFEFETKILKYVEGRAPVATPALLSPAHGCGQPYLEHGSAMIMLYKMLDGKCLEQSQLSKNVALQAGQCLHKFTDTFGDFQRTADAPEGGISYIANITEKLRTRTPDIFKDLRLSKMYQYIAHFPKVADLNNSPQGIVHGDFFFENTLWTDDGNLVGVIDFGDCFFGSMLHDIAVGAMEFSIREGEQLDMEAFDAFLSPFSSWFAKSATGLELFRATLLANCVRYSTHLIALGLDEGEPFSSLVSVEYNPYIDRFQRFLQPESLAYVSNRFPSRGSA